jgi:hypothetical protein
VVSTERGSPVLHTRCPHRRTPPPPPTPARNEPLPDRSLGAPQPEAESDEDRAIQLLPADEKEVVQRLRKRIKDTGDPNAARELRAWLDRAKEAAPKEVDVREMTRVQRDWMIARLDEEYRAMQEGMRAFRLLGP